MKEDEKIPESGEGSEYGRKWREEARKRKRGYASRKEDPDEMPWVLKEKKRGGAQYVGMKGGETLTSFNFDLVVKFLCLYTALLVEKKEQLIPVLPTSFSLWARMERLRLFQSKIGD